MFSITYVAISFYKTCKHLLGRDSIKYMANPKIMMMNHSFDIQLSSAKNTLNLSNSSTVLLWHFLEKNPKGIFHFYLEFDILEIHQGPWPGPVSPMVSLLPTSV